MIVLSAIIETMNDDKHTYATATAHLLAVLAAGDRRSVLVLHRDAVRQIPDGCYAVVKVEIMPFSAAVPYTVTDEDR